MMSGNRCVWIVALTLFAGGAGGVASGGALALHVGNADPAAEGFTLSNNGDMLGSVGPLTGDGAQMLDAWFTDDEGSSSNLSYGIELSEEQTALMASKGFRLSVRMRSPSVPDDTDFGMAAQVENGERQFLLRFGNTVNGLPLVVANGVETFLLVPGAPDDYHLYELVDDDADGDADLYIDGELRLADYAGVPTTRRLVAFGDTSTTAGSGGRAHWNLVSLDAIEPCPADVNGDGFIGFADLNAIVSVFNTDCPGVCAEDVNGDHFIGFADLNIVVSAFNTDCP